MNGYINNLLSKLTYFINNYARRVDTDWDSPKLGGIDTMNYHYLLMTVFQSISMHMSMHSFY